MKPACAMVKNINYTSMAITMLMRKKQHHQTILDNRISIDYSMLLHHKGCCKFNNLCCFNLVDNRNYIKKDLDYLKDIVKKVQQDDGGWEVLD